MTEPVTITNLHEFADKHCPDCRERRVLHLALERLLQFEVGQVPELRAKLCQSDHGAPFVTQGHDDLTERQVAQALFGLDTMADEWAASVDLPAMARSITPDKEQADKLVALMKQSWVEGAYTGRISQFTDPPQNSAVGKTE